MDTIWGCDTETMDDLAEKVGDAADRLRHLIEALRRASVTVTWIGPDATAHRERTATMVAGATDLCAVLRERARQLEEESSQQTAASRADGAEGPLRDVRADLSDLLPGPLRARTGEIDPFPEVSPGFRHPTLPASPPTMPDLDPFVGTGPGFRAPVPVGENPFAFPDLPGPLGNPLIGGPFAHRAPQERADLSEGEEYDLTDRALENGSAVRRRALSYVPGASQAQQLMGLHDMQGNLLDGAEEVLVANGYDALVPAVDSARIGQSAASLAIGENSTLGQVAGGLDMMVANAGQTTVEVGDAVLHGDLGAAVRAGERGVYRQYEGLATVLTASPVWTAPGVAGDMAGHAADAVESVSPAAAQPLRTVESTSHELGDRITAVKDGLLDSEGWYDGRRRAVPLLWDPK